MNNRYFSIFTASIIIIAALWIILPFWHAFVWAGIIAISVWPVYEYWYALLAKNSTLASLSFTLIIGCVIILPIIWISSLAGSELATLIAYLRSASANQTPAPEWLVTIPFVGNYLSSLWNQYILSGHSLTDILSTLNLPISQAGLIITRATGYAVIFFFTMLCLFFGLKDAPEIVKKIEKVGKNRVSLWQRYIERTPKVIRGVIDSFVIIGLITGIIMGFTYYLFNVPIPVILAIITALVTVIPFALVVLLIGISIIIAAQGTLFAGIAIFVIGMVVNLITDNWIRPIIIGRSIRMHFIATLFGALGGLEVLGFIGLFLGPVIVSLAILVWDEILLNQ